jgi:hypothetical protein
VASQLGGVTPDVAQDRTVVRGCGGARGMAPAITMRMAKERSPNTALVAIVTRELRVVVGGARGSGFDSNGTAVSWSSSMSGPQFRNPTGTTPPTPRTIGPR